MHLICANPHVVIASSVLSGRIPIVAGGIRMLQKSHYELVQDSLQSSAWPGQQRSPAIIQKPAREFQQSPHILPAPVKIKNTQFIISTDHSKKYGHNKDLHK